MCYQKIQVVKKVWLPALFSILIFSCKKNKEEEPTSTPGNEINEVFAQNGAPVQTFTIANSSNVTKYTTDGNYFVLSANSFVDTNGNQVTGNIDVEVKETMSKKEIILSALTTQAADNFLISGGMMYFGATQNGSTLKLASGKSINTFIKTTFGKLEPMKKYEDALLPKNPFEGTANWTASVDSSALPMVQDTTGTNSFYFWSVGTLGWINCDYFYSNPNPKTSVIITLDQAYNNSNASVFFSVNGKNVIGRADYTGGSVFTLTNIPVNTGITFIAIAKVSNKYYASYSSTTTVQGLALTPVLNATNIGDIRSALSNLP